MNRRDLVIRAIRVLVFLCLAASAGTAMGGQVPESAYSRSLSIRPEFLDYTTLLFQFPQRAAATRSQLPKRR